jgi:hypothetical protein
MASLLELAQADHSGDPVTKPLRYYEIYEQALLEEGLVPTSILEIGVFHGESTKAFARCFPNAHIVALDLQLRNIDFSGFDNIHYLQCDQTDRVQLQSICEEHFQNGVDLVIDDASHIGHFSRLTFNCVFPYVNSGGLYIVEDWGTGYWETWVDGGRFIDSDAPSAFKKITKAIQSHNLGMVGFVKSLVDYTATDDIEDDRAAVHGLSSRLILFAGRFQALRKCVEKTPRLRSWLVKHFNKHSSAQTTKAPRVKTAIPRLKWLKFFRGVCVACKE